MDATELLREHHDTLAELFEFYEAARLRPSAIDRRDIAGEICEQLRSHCRMAEDVLYPALRLRDHDPFAQDLLERAVGRLHAALDLARELEGLSATEPAFDALVSRLRDLVIRHLVPEERDVLCRAAQALAPAERADLGARMESRQAAEAAARTRAQAERRGPTRSPSPC